MVSDGVCRLALYWYQDWWLVKALGYYGLCVCVCACVRACTRTSVRVCVRVCKRTSVRACVCMCVCEHAYCCGPIRLPING